MNLFAPLGVLLGALVVAFGVKDGVKNSLVFLDMHAAVIVLGGTLATALIIFPLKQFVNLIKVYFRTVLGLGHKETLNVINEIIMAAQAVDQGQEISTITPRVKNHFLKESLVLLEDSAFSEDELYEVLLKRVEVQNEKYHQEGHRYKVLGKFPPAFGLVGTTVGMIGLLQGIGSPEGFQQIGPSMSIALVATFYGLILTNIIIVPVGENLVQASEEDLLMRRIVVDGVRLIKEQKHPLVVSEYLKSYLTPEERNRLRKV